MDDSIKKKRKQLKKLQPNAYRIYGILNLKSEKLIYVNLDLGEVTFKFDLDGYDDCEFAVISFKVVVN